jgi:hypothetical protein
MLLLSTFLIASNFPPTVRWFHCELYVAHVSERIMTLKLQMTAVWINWGTKKNFYSHSAVLKIVGSSVMVQNVWNSIKWQLLYHISKQFCQ